MAAEEAMKALQEEAANSADDQVGQYPAQLTGYFFTMWANRVVFECL